MSEIRKFWRNRWTTNFKRYVAAGFLPFNSMSNWLRTPSGERFREILLPGCFRDLENSDVQILLDHDDKKRVSKVVDLWTDEDGLVAKFFLPQTKFSEDILAQLEANKLQLSPAFKVHRDSWSRENGVAVRRIASAELLELSLVEHAAYSETSACSLEEKRNIKALEERTVRFISGLLVVEEPPVKVDYSVLERR